jgi:hypothetical protein
VTNIFQKQPMAIFLFLLTAVSIGQCVNVFVISEPISQAELIKKLRAPLRVKVCAYVKKLDMQVFALVKKSKTSFPQLQELLDIKDLQAELLKTMNEDKEFYKEGIDLLEANINLLETVVVKYANKDIRWFILNSGKIDETYKKVITTLKAYCFHKSQIAQVSDCLGLQKKLSGDLS